MADIPAAGSVTSDAAFPSLCLCDNRLFWTACAFWISLPSSTFSFFFLLKAVGPNSSTVQFFFLSFLNLSTTKSYQAVRTKRKHKKKHPKDDPLGVTFSCVWWKEAFADAVLFESLCFAQLPRVAPDIQCTPNPLSAFQNHRNVRLTRWLHAIGL